MSFTSVLGFTTSEKRAEVVTQITTCLSSMHETLVPSLAPHKLDMVTYKPSIWEVETRGSKVQVILGYRAGLRPACGTLSHKEGQKGKRGICLCVHVPVLKVYYGNYTNICCPLYLKKHLARQLTIKNTNIKHNLCLLYLFAHSFLLLF